MIGKVDSRPKDRELDQSEANSRNRRARVGEGSGTPRGASKIAGVSSCWAFLAGKLLQF